MNGLDINTIWIIVWTSYTLFILFIWGLFIPWLSKLIQGEKKKARDIYSPLYQFLKIKFNNNMVNYYVNPKIGAESIELLEMIQEARNKLADFSNTRNDKKLLRELEQVYRDCHSLMIELKEQNNGKIPPYAHFKIEKIIKPIRDKIFNKVKKLY